MTLGIIRYRGPPQQPIHVAQPNVHLHTVAKPVRPSGPDVSQTVRAKILFAPRSPEFPTRRRSYSTAMPSDTPIISPQVKTNDIGLPYLALSISAKEDPMHEPHGKISSQKLHRFVKPADARNVAPPPQPDGFPMRGKMAHISLDGVQQAVVVQGMDFRGRPVVTDSKQQERVVTDPQAAKKLTSANIVPASCLQNLSSGRVLTPSQTFIKSMKAVLSKAVVGSVSSLAYMQWLRDRGVESFVLGGCIRDLVKATSDDPALNPQDMAKLVNDIDITTTAYSDVAKQVFKAFHADDPSIHFAGFDIYGSMHWKDAKNPEGFDFNCMMVGGTYDPPIVRLDTPQEGRIPPSVFDHDPLLNTLSLDFCCNALTYDPFNEVLVDPTGFGVADAQNRFLRPTGGELVSTSFQDTVLYKSPDLHLRFWKFRYRGFTSNLFTTRAFLAKAYAKWSTLPETQLLAEITKIMPMQKLSGTDAEKTQQAQRMIDQLIKVLKEDEQFGMTDFKIAEKFVEANREKLVYRMVNLTKPMGTH